MRRCLSADDPEQKAVHDADNDRGDRHGLPETRRAEQDGHAKSDKKARTSEHELDVREEPVPGGRHVVIN